eukprot:248851_1
MMDDFFANKLSGGPLSGILSGYSSNKLLSKSRITKSDREHHEDEQIQTKEEEIKQRKNRKRKQREEEEKDKYIIPKGIAAKRMKLSNDDISIAHNSATDENDNANDDKDSNDIALNLTPKQVITRLRELKQPIRYFGETDEDRLKRLRRLEIIHHERHEGASKGLKNVALSIKDEVERELEAAMAQSMTQIKKDGGNELDIHSKRQELKKNKYDKPRNRSSFAHSEDYVLFWFKRMLREWEQSLLARSQDEKLSLEGKNATMLQKQARRDIRALFKQLKNRTVPRDVLFKSEKLVVAAEKRNYVEAKRIFFEMAIGNAPWPMGVTMVGIHERSGRSRFLVHRLHM